MNERFQLAPLTTQAAEGLSRRPWTVAEIEAMVAAGIIDEDERFELIGGDAMPMVPKSPRHEAVKIELNRHFQKIVPEHLSIAQETTLRLDDVTPTDEIAALREAAVTMCLAQLGLKPL